MSGKRLTRRGLLRMAALGGAGAFLASCTPKVVEKVVQQTVEVEKQVEVEKAVTVTPGPAAGPVTVKIWTTGSDFDAQMIMQAGEIYKLANPNVTIAAEPVSWSDAHTKILAAVTAKSGPDVITGGMSWGIELGRQGGMLDLKEGYPDMVLKVKEKTMPGIWGAIVPPTGEVYAVEWASSLMLNFYRTDILKDVCGLTEPPKTWDQFSAMLDGLKASGRTEPVGLGFANMSWLGYFNFLYQAGGRFYDDQCTQVTMNSPEGLAALKYYTDLYLRYGANPQGLQDTVGFEKGDMPVLIDGNWQIPTLDLTKPELAGKWVIAPMAAGPSGKRTSFIGGTVIGIMSYVAPDVRDAAADFIGFLYTPEAVRAEANYATAQKSMFIPPAAEFAQYMPTAETYKQAIAETLQDAYGPPNCKGWEESNVNVDQAIQEVVLNNADPQQALAKAADALTQSLTQ